MNNFESDFVQLARLALAGQEEDVRLFVARLVRKYRSTNPALAELMDAHLKSSSPRSTSAMRKSKGYDLSVNENRPLPVDEESRLSLLKRFDPLKAREAPLLTEELKQQMEQLIAERRQLKHLESLGLQPTRSAVFVGPPGVGKTLTARWLATQLDLPLYVLDLTAVMSSFLGRSGTNLRAALDFAKSRPCVLLLDEIDAVAKRRSDDGDIGELKRLVTVILQEVDAWPTCCLLLAATNHPELIDPALWRRFDLKVEFDNPSQGAVKQAITQFLGEDRSLFEPWLDVMVPAFHGLSFSDVERELMRMRRVVALRQGSPAELVATLVNSRSLQLDRKDRVEFAVKLARSTPLSQHNISDITGVSRDTIRKHVNPPNRSQLKKQTA